MIIKLNEITIEDKLEGRKADQSLINSIEVNGLLNPLKVYRDGDKYVLLDGHRRVDALLTLYPEGDVDVPVDVMDTPDTTGERRTIQVILNRNRKDIKPTHVAESISMLKAQGYKQKDIAKRFGLSEPEVSTYLTLDRGHEKLRKAVDSGRVSLSAIEPLLTKPYRIQEELSDTAIRARTVRKVRALVKTHEMKNDITAPTIQLEENIDPLEFLALEELRNIEQTLVGLSQESIESVTIQGEMRDSLERIRVLVQDLEVGLDTVPF